MPSDIAAAVERLRTILNLRFVGTPTSTVAVAADDLEQVLAELTARQERGQGQPPNRKLSDIPYGRYCYSAEGVCPHWSRVADRPEQENGYCSHIRKGDWEFPGGLLWDQCKECGERMYEPEELEEGLRDAQRKLADSEQSNEPVTEEWLRSIGFVPDIRDPQRELVLTGPDVDLIYYNESWWVDDCGGCRVLLTNRLPGKTRGDVLNLCSALGIDTAREAGK